MSQQLSVRSFFKKPNNNVDNKKGEKRGIDADEDEGQTQPLASVERASGSKEVRQEYRVQWEQEFSWLRREDGKM